jgi:fatty-acyl-CoA synthase
MRMVPFNINYRYVGGEFQIPARQRRLRALVYHHSLASVVRDVLPDTPLVKLAVEVDDGDGEGEGWDRGRRYEALLAASTPAPRITRQPDDYHLMYTGGTTGLPKGVICEVVPGNRAHGIFAQNVLGLAEAAAGNP